MSGNSRANIVPMNDLDALAERIRQCHYDVEHSLRTALARALDAGDLFNQALAAVPKGGRGRFINSTGVPRRTAYFWMELADNRLIIETECATVAHLSVRGAKTLITDVKKADQSDDPDDGDADPRDTEDENEAEAQELLDLYRNVSDDARSRFLDLAGLSETA